MNSESFYTNRFLSNQANPGHWVGVNSTQSHFFFSTIALFFTGIFNAIKHVHLSVGTVFNQDTVNENAPHNSGNQPASLKLRSNNLVQTACITGKTANTCVGDMPHKCSMNNQLMNLLCQPVVRKIAAMFRQNTPKLEAQVLYVYVVPASTFHISYYEKMQNNRVDTMNIQNSYS